MQVQQNKRSIFYGIKRTEKEFFILPLTTPADDDYMSFFNVLPDFIIKDQVSIEDTFIHKEKHLSTLKDAINGHHDIWHRGRRVNSANLDYKENIDSNSDWGKIVTTKELSFLGILVV